MRSEQQVRDRLEGEMFLYSRFETKMCDAARACIERIRVLEWLLGPTMPMSEPPEVPKRRRRGGDGSGNGTV